MLRTFKDDLNSAATTTAGPQTERCAKRRENAARKGRRDEKVRDPSDLHSDLQNHLTCCNVCADSEVDSTKAVIDQLSGQCLKLQEQKASLQQRISICGVDISNNTKDQQRFSKELRELTSGKRTYMSNSLRMSKMQTHGTNCHRRKLRGAEDPQVGRSSRRTRRR